MSFSLERIVVRAWGSLAAVLVLCATAAFGGQPAMRLLKTPPSGDVLLRNGDFEQVIEGKPSSWAAAPVGFVLVPGEGLKSTRALKCENRSANQWSGASQTVVLNRTSANPLVVRGWSRAVDISGSSDSGYSLYVDIEYHDGTPLWGRTANFRTGTHDWQMRELVILPEKPVKTLTLHCLLRGHTGAAWFDDVSLYEITAAGPNPLFQGLPITVVRPAKSDTGTTSSVATRDGLSLTMRDGAVVSLQVSGSELAGNAPSGFLARDVEAGSDIYGFTDGACPDLSLKVSSRFRAERDHIVLEGRVSDTAGRDRAITLFFALPVDAIGWHWGDDIRHSRGIEESREFANNVVVGAGATGTMSLYPLGAIYDSKAGIALAVDMDQPAQYRLAYNAGTKQFFVAYDFGLVPETQRFPGSADFRFVIFRFDPQWGFRAAFQKFMEAFPGHFVVRSREQGIWMPFTDVSTVQEWQDFGFKYHEGNNAVPWDDEHGVLSFRYTEPMTWWMRMQKGIPRTFVEALRVREQLARGADAHQKRMAQVCQLAGAFDETGEPALLFKNEPWCDGAVWSVNPNPGLPVPKADDAPAFNGATVYWNQDIKDSLYGAKAKGNLDGEYLDSIEGYVTAELNFRREHFRHSTVPLTFSSDTKQPAIHKGLAVYEFTKWMSEDVHRMGKLMFANGVPYRFTFLSPWLDVLGTETDWLVGGKYQPASDAQMNLWRTMSGKKPYVLLMNTDYNALSPELVERYFQRSLFYGIYPSMFSHNAAENPYWRNPKWYNRDRPLFKKYLPIIKRVAEAGWEPVTWAGSSNARVLMERFGPVSRASTFFTLMNDTDSPQQVRFWIDRKGLMLNDPLQARELLSASSLEVSADGGEVSLKPRETKVVEITPVR